MEQVLPGGDYAVILHKGPYDNLQDTWQWIGEIAFPNLNRECRDQPPFECYLNSPADTAPDELLTEIYIPLD
jgi:AraC family transcriptional regulator